MDQNSTQSPADLEHDVYVNPSRPSHATRKQAGKRRKRLMLGVVGALIVVLIAAGCLWFFVLNNKKTGKSAAPTATPQSQTEAVPETTPADATPVSFKSTKLNLELTHRKDWTLKEGSDGAITVTSPRISYTRVDGSAGAGVFTLKIRKGATEAMQTTIDKAVAVRGSEVIAYAAPTQAQRYYTNISYAGQEAAFNFFIVTGSVEIKDGKPFAYLLNFDKDAYVIAGGYGLDKDGTLSFDAVPKTAIDSEAKDEAIKIVESIKLF